MTKEQRLDRAIAAVEHCTKALIKIANQTFRESQQTVKAIV